MSEPIESPTRTWHDELRTHLRDTHQNVIAGHLTDDEAREQHWSAHARGGELADHDEPADMHISRVGHVPARRSVPVEETPMRDPSFVVVEESPTGAKSVVDGTLFSSREAADAATEVYRRRGPDYVTYSVRPVHEGPTTLMAARDDLRRVAERLKAKAAETGDKTYLGTASGVHLACLRLIELADKSEVPGV